MELSAECGAPNSIGRKYARRYAARKSELLKLASWDGSDLFTPLFLAQTDVVLSRINAFGSTLKEGEKVRQKITLANFATVLREMTPFFDPAERFERFMRFTVCSMHGQKGPRCKSAPSSGSSDLGR